MPEKQSTPGAVFLSYAREDAEAARRIADALRAFGQEVWLDQSELRGGDTWDAKIRGQIRACALFMPVISANTQERAEGYFRREWKLGVERTHDMASGVAFVVPVVVDDTKESDAMVPDEFLRFQWVRLPHGVPTPQFIEQVKALIENPRRARGASGAGSNPPAPAAVRPAPPRKSWMPAAIVCAAAVVAAAVFMTRKTAPAPEPPKPAAAAKAAPPAGEKSIAVLPFANFSPDKDNEFFADGLQDEVITALAKIHDLKVISRTSVLAYRNPEGRNLKKIADELDVATVLEGSVQRVGTKVHLNVQLIDARTDDHLWAESYTDEMTDVFALESTLAQQIAAALKANLTTGEKALIERRPTQNQEAYDLYLRALVLEDGMSYLSPRAEYESVISLYGQAGAKDPGFSLPHVQASIMHGVMHWFPLLDYSEDRKAKSLAELQVAERLAPNAPETRLARGDYKYTCLYDWEGALSEFRAAATELPNDDQILQGMGRALRRLGRLNEALEVFEKANSFDPNDNNTAATVVETCFTLHRYARTVELARSLGERFPQETYFAVLRHSAQLEIDGDWDAFVKDSADDNALGEDTAIQVYRYAMLRGDLPAAERLLSDPRTELVSNDAGTLLEPGTLHRAYVAFLLGKADDARGFSKDALAKLRAIVPTKRMLPWVHMAIARAEAYQGKFDAAIRDGKEAYDEIGSFDALEAGPALVDYGRILVMANHRDEALSVLSQVVTKPLEVYSPRMLQHDLVWSRLKDDPRFLPIIESDKPL
ncbi:MAG TPA: TIR domain-containing protein [Opitutaceae bacterium]